MSYAPRRAAALIIGNELLTGKIQDANVRPLAQMLQRLGIMLGRVVFCEDDIDVIAREVQLLSHTHDFLFTSGGVGPTHDDLTMFGVARGLDRELEENAAVRGLIETYFRERMTDGHLRMAQLPQGAELMADESLPWPIIVVENVYVLPGVPKLFARKLPQIEASIEAGVPFLSRAIETACDEGTIAKELEVLSDSHPHVAIGSYPRFTSEGVRVRLTFDGQDGDAIERAMAEFLSRVEPELILGVE